MVGLLVNGVIQASMLVLTAFLLARFTRDVVGRAFLAFFLIGAAATYIWFAVRSGEGAGWITAEAIGVAVYGTMGVLGVRGSHWWLVAGWAVHPVWDVALHYLGPGGAFAPVEYAITCLSFDLVVAAYIAAVYRYGLLGSRSTARSAEGVSSAHVEQDVPTG